jgi:hypothetical protein
LSWRLGRLYGVLGLFDPVGAVDLSQLGTDQFLQCLPWHPQHMTQIDNR